MPVSAPEVEGYYDADSGTVSYLLLDPASRQCALIDSVLDYDHKAGRTATRSADRLVARVRALGASVAWILETHVHADHLSAAPYLKAQLGGRLGIGQHITRVQQVFGKLFNVGDMACDGSQFDHLFADDERFDVGTLRCRALHTPGHTPACMSYVVGDGAQSVAFVATRCSCPTTAPRAATSPAATRPPCTARSAACSACPPRRGCTCATTTCRAAANCATPAPWPSSAPTTSTCATASAK